MKRPAAEPEHRPRIGYATTTHRSGELRQLGYDFVEARLQSYGLVDRDSLAAAQRAVASSALPVLGLGVFYPPDLRLVGDEVDPRRVKNYLSLAAEFAASCDTAVAVMGSSAARNVPAGYERQRAEQQLLQSYDWACDAFAGSGCTLAIEPQCRKETNIITSIPEAVRFAENVNRPELRVVADFYHMDEEDEPLEHVRTYADWIVYVQLADTGRRNPGSGHYDYDTFFGHLKAGGYSGPLSLEVAGDLSVDELQDSLAFLGCHWRDAG